MAFATSEVVLRRADDAWRTTGRWTGAIGDAAGTITVPGMRVDEAVFNNNLATGGPANSPAVTFTSSGGIVTVTVHNAVTVSGGFFTIVSR